MILNHVDAGFAEAGRLSGGASQFLRMWKLLLALICFLAAAGAQTKPDKMASADYELVELPLRPISISNSAWIAGTTHDQHAALWNAQAGLSVAHLADEFSFSECGGVNSKGEGACTASTADSSRRVAFSLKNGRVTFLPGEQSRANGINEGGDIVGQSLLPGNKAAGPVEWKNDNATDLKLCCAGAARSIDTKNLVVGDTYDTRGHYHGFVWDVGRGGRLLSIPGEEYSSALAVNDRGEILVKAVPGGLFLYSEGKLKPIDIPKATPRALNNNGMVVGSYGPGPEAQRAFIWDATHGMRDLNTLIPAGSGWTLEVASSINDSGEIVGWGDHGRVENAGFLLRVPGKEK